MIALYDSKIEACDLLKAELDAIRPLNEHALLQLKQYYRVGLTYTSNAIEGNTLTETETKVVLEDGITIGGKPLKDHLAALGHAKAVDLLYTLTKDTTPLTESRLRTLHQLVTEGMDDAEPGQYRSKPVIMTGTSYIPPHPQDIATKVQAFWQAQLPQWQATLHPIDSAAWAHLELVTIHPFIDGNGRTARLLMNLLLMRSGYPVTLIPPILRVDYIATLRAYQEEQASTPFLNFISHCVYESAKSYKNFVSHFAE